jgi:hypothetical protein
MILLIDSWTTSTFLLSNDPYNYTPLKIGLLGLLGLLGAMLAPLWGRLVDKIVPWSGQMLGAIMCLIAMLIALGAADINIAGVAIPLMLYDCGAQLFVVSNGYRVAGLDAKARARLNSCVLLFMFMGQVSHSHKYCISADKVDCWNGNLDQDLRCQRMESNRRNCSSIRIRYGPITPSQVSNHFPFAVIATKS